MLYSIRRAAVRRQAAKLNGAYSPRLLAAKLALTSAIHALENVEFALDVLGGNPQTRVDQIMTDLLDALLKRADCPELMEAYVSFWQSCPRRSPSAAKKELQQRLALLEAAVGE